MLRVVSVIRAGTKAAEGVSKEDMDKRMKVLVCLLVLIEVCILRAAVQSINVC